VQPNGAIAVLFYQELIRACTFAPQTLNMIERLSVEPIQQKQGLKENCSTSVRDKNLGTQ
jgi:hypothetical protein